MNEPPGTELVLTIGHSTHAVDSFVELLRRHGVTAVADVRSAPYSRFNPQFNRDSFADALKAAGIRYVFLGDALGGRSDDPACYEDGRIRYDRVAATKSFQRGLGRVEEGAKSYRIALMCAEKEPLDCHRTLLVARELNARGVEVAHIHADREQLEPHQEAMERLRKIWNLHGDDLFRHEEDVYKTAVDLQARRVAHVDHRQAARPRKQPKHDEPQSPRTGKQRT